MPKEYDQMTDIEKDIADAFAEVEGEEEEKEKEENEVVDVKEDSAEETEATEEATEGDGGEGPTEEEQKEAVEDVLEAINAPASYKKDIVEKHWDALPADLKNYLLQRETEATRKINELAEASKTTSFDGVFSPEDVQLIKSNGLDEKTYVNNMLAWDKALRSDPQAAISQLAQVYGVNVGLENNPDSQYTAMQQQLNSMTGFIRSQQIEQQQAQLASTQNDIAELETNTEKYPYFNDVREDMAQMIESGLANSLQEAYDKAIYLNSTTRSAIFEKEKQQLVESKTEEERQRTAKAKGAAVSLKPTNKGKSVKKQKDFGNDIAAEMRHLAEEAGLY